MEPEAYCLHKTHEPVDPRPFELDRHYLLYALSGTLRLEAQGFRWTLPPARAALIAAGHPVMISVLTRMTSASVLFAPSFMPAPQQAVCVFEMSQLARELIGECRHWGPDHGDLPPYARHIFAALAAVALKLTERPSPFVMPIPASAPLERALALTGAQADCDPSFAAIARETGQSTRALARRFADEMGMTWRQALRRMRMMRAVEALATSDAPVTEIALAVGYNSLSAFNAAFRDLVGVNPTEYRKSLRT